MRTAFRPLLAAVFLAACPGSLFPPPSPAEDAPPSPPAGTPGPLPAGPASESPALAEENASNPPKKGPSVEDILNRALAAEKRGAPADAFQIALTAFAREPANPRISAILHRTGHLIHERTERENDRRRKAHVRAAKKRLENARLKQRDLYARHREGRRLLDKNRVFEASDVFNRLREESPDFLPAVRGLDKVQKVLGTRLRKGRFPSPAHFSATEGVHAYNAGDWAKAADALDPLAQKGGLPEDLAAARLGEYAAAARAKMQKSRWQAERKALMEKALQAYLAGRLKEAQGLCQDILARDPADAEAKSQLETVNHILSGARQSVEAERREKEIADRMANGTLLMIQERHADAMEEFLRVLELDPGHAEAREQLAETRRAMGREGLFVPDVPLEDAAEKEYREGLRLYGDERYDAAAAAFESTLKLNPRHKEAKQALERLRDQTP